MKKNTLYIFIVFVVLLIVAVFVFFNKYSLVRNDVAGKKEWKIELKKATIKALRDFAVEDTAIVDKIFLADKQNNTILLERDDNYWTVNGSYIARRDFMDLLLETIHRVEVSEPVSEAKLETVFRNLSVNSIKIEIYENGELAKTYFVGGVNQESTGTYMMIDGSTDPFVTHIPGFSGFLTTRYNTNVYEWRDRVVFRYKYNDISEISLKFPDNPEASFRCTKSLNNKFKLYGLPDNVSIPDFDTLMLKEFMARYKHVAFESFLNEIFDKETRDTIIERPSLCHYTVTNRKGETTRLSTMLRPNVNKQFDDSGIFYPFDVERLYGFINNNEDMVLMQYFTIDPITYELQDFLLNTAISD